LAASGFGEVITVWEDVKTEPEGEVRYAVKPPFRFFTEEEVLAAIARNGGLVRIDDGRTVDELVAHKMAGKEIVPILNDRIIERQEF
jgi:hypothetical protein